MKTRAHDILMLCSILYQRGIYPSESFQQQKHYGLSMMVTTDPGLTKYLTSVLQQMSGEQNYLISHKTFLSLLQMSIQDLARVSCQLCCSSASNPPESAEITCSDSHDPPLLILRACSLP
jgi:hypothetical protein